MTTRRQRLAPPAQGSAQGAGRARRVLPFGGLGLLVLIAYLATAGSSLDGAELAALATVLLAVALAWCLVPWHALPRDAQALLPLAVVGLIVMMQAFALPDDIDLLALMVIPVLWSGLYGTAREVVAVTTASITAVVVLEAVSHVTSSLVGLTSWTEVIALVGVLGLLGYFTVTARAHARTDSLTGVANRRAWDEILGFEIERGRRYPVHLAVAMLDLDHFKKYNDMHGHPVGDSHLVACASAWQHCLRATDVLARLGGEEFAVLLIGVGPEAVDIAERLLHAVPDGESCSIGIAAWDGREDAAGLMARADQALYAAKDAGRARVVAA